MITEIAHGAAATAADLLQKALDSLQDAEMELEDTLEQYDDDLDASFDDEEDRGQVVADLLWDTRELYNEVEDLVARVSDYSEAVERACQV